jgi:hypothetical protein
MLALQRHGIFPTLASAWNSTGNPVYAARLDALVSDWVVFAGLAPTTVTNAFHCGGPPDWLTLDSGLRQGGSWPPAFFLAQQSPNFTAVGRLLMASSIAQQAKYLAMPSAKSATANWEATQSVALMTTGLAFPEFANASQWVDIGVAGVLQLMQTGVYPDGVSTEQTSGYDQVALGAYDAALRLFEAAGIPSPPTLHAGVERMYTYVAQQMSSDGTQVLNGDSDLTNLRSGVVAAAARFGRPDWLYMATDGLQGQLPALGNGSVMFPWAGQLVMRSAWGTSPEHEQLWAWFDVGPFGSSCHSHRDKLHLSVRAHGEHLLVDSGRFG